MMPHARNGSTRHEDPERSEIAVKAGQDTSKSELIRLATMRALYDEERIGRLNATTSKLQKRTKSKKQVDEEIEWAKAGTRITVSKMLKG